MHSASADCPSSPHPCCRSCGRWVPRTAMLHGCRKLASLLARAMRHAAVEHGGQSAAVAANASLQPPRPPPAHALTPQLPLPVQVMSWTLPFEDLNPFQVRGCTRLEPHCCAVQTCRHCHFPATSSLPILFLTPHVPCLSHRACCRSSRWFGIGARRACRRHPTTSSQQAPCSPRTTKHTCS